MEQRGGMYTRDAERLLERGVKVYAENRMADGWSKSEIAAHIGDMARALVDSVAHVPANLPGSV